MDAHELLRIAEDAAVRAGELLLERWHGPARGVGTKSSPTDLVSDADRVSEAFLLNAISKERPGDGVLAEEGSGKRSETGILWIVDPLDGTVNYLYGIPVWSVSVAADDAKGTVLGVVHDPTRAETFTALRGEGARLNGAPIHVSDESDLTQALIGTGFAYEKRTRAAQAEVVARVLPAVRDIRRAGSAALDLAALACGRLDGFYEAFMERWDRAAGALIVKEAGAVVSDLPAPYGDAVGVVAANPRLHDELRSLVAR